MSEVIPGIIFEETELRREPKENKLVPTKVIKVEIRVVKDGVTTSVFRDANEEEKKYFLSKKGK